MKNTPAVQSLMDRLHLHQKYITYTIEGYDGQDEIVNVSVREAAHEITRNKRKLADLTDADALAHRYAEVRGWKVYMHSIGYGSQG